MPKRKRTKSVTKTLDAASPRKDPAAVALGRRGGLKGGKARALKLSPAERSQSASIAAQARWTKEKRQSHG